MIRPLAAGLIALLAFSASALAEGDLVSVIQMKDRDTALAMLKQGADVTIPGPDGTTALMWAANSGWISVVRRLLDAGARVSVVAKDGWTAVEAARMAGHADIVRVLEEAM